MASPPAPPSKNSRIAVLFDVDGTLTIPRKEVTQDVLTMLEKLRERVVVGFVGGSDLAKQREQLGEDCTDRFDYCFSQNGLVAYRDGELFHTNSIKDFLGDERVKQFVNFCMAYLSGVDCPVKRGTFIEFRSGMFNISPVGRNCSREERNEFEEFDLKHGVRAKMVEVLRAQFPDFGLQYSIGGQISFDVFPKGWDKTYCLQFLNPEDYDEVHFFGDKTFKGGNDFEIANHPRTTEHPVKEPADTLQIINELFGV